MNNLNFPNMMGMQGGGGGGGGAPQAQMQQRPQGTIPQQQMLNHFRQQPATMPWHQAVSPEERTRNAHNIFNSFRLAKPDTPANAGMQWAIKMEMDAFRSQPSKEAYAKHIHNRLTALQQDRQRQALMSMQGNNPQSTPGMGMMPGMPMQNTPSGQGQNQFSQGFPPQLQHQMQASPIPMQNQNPAPNMGNPNQGGGMTPQQQMQAQQNMQRPGQPNQGHAARVMAMAMEYMKRTPDDRKQAMRIQLQNQMANNPEVRQKIGNKDPLLVHFEGQAMKQLREQLSRQGQVQPGQNSQIPGGMMQNNAQTVMQQTSSAQGQSNGAQDFNFAQLTEQQADALRASESGQQVVPASNNLSFAQQMGFGANMTGQGQNGQPAGQGQNAAFAAQRQQLMNQQAAQMRNQQAQIQAQAQARQQAALRGQAGGLNMPQGPGQSPAMPYLTKPMAPPGQQGPATPQQRPQGMPPTAQTPGQMGMMNGGMQGQQQHAMLTSIAERTSMIPPNVPDAQKQQLLTVNEETFQAIINRLKQNNAAQMQQRQIPVSQPAHNPGFTMGQPPNPGMPQGNMNMGQAMQPGNQPMSQQEQVRQRQIQMMREFDNKPLPNDMINHLTMKAGMPQQIRTWQQVKAWAAQNPNLPAEFNPQRLQQMQRYHFQKWLDIQKNQVALQNANGQAPPGGLNAQAPQARMFPSGTPGAPQAQMMQQPPGTQPFPVQPVTPQEIAVYKQRVPQMANQPDEVVRTAILKVKLQQRQQQMDLAKSHQQQQLQRPGSQAPQVPQMAPGQPPPVPNIPQQNAQQIPQAPKMEPQQSQNKAQAQFNNATQAQMAKGVKRPNDDVMEVPNPNPNKTAPPVQAVAHNAQGPTREQLAKMTPQQQAAFRQEQLRRAQEQNNKQVSQPQDASQPARPTTITDAMKKQRQERLRMLAQEVAKRQPQMQPLSIPHQAREELVKKVQNYSGILEKADYIIAKMFELTGKEPVVVEFFNMRMPLFKQLLNNFQGLNEQITMSPKQLDDTLERMVRLLRAMAQHLNSHAAAEKARQGQKDGAATDEQVQQQAQPAAAQGATAPPELSAANLQMLRQQQQQQHRRSQSKSGATPAAPTSAQPPVQFPLGAASPQGVPLYAGNSLPETFKPTIPPKKKQKPNQGSAGSTPVHVTAGQQSPQVGKPPSPDFKRKPDAAQQPVPVKPSFPCPVSECDYHTKGFDNKQDLTKHYSDMHTQPEDTLKYALEGMAMGMGFNKDGTPMGVPHPSTAGAKSAAPASNMQATTGKPSQTGSIKQDVMTPGAGVSTPMARVSTQNGSTAKASPSASLLKTPQGASIKGQTPSSLPAKGTPGKAAAAKEAASSTIGKPATQPPSITVDAVQEPEKDAWADCPVSPGTLQSIFDFELPGLAAPSSTLDETWAMPRSSPPNSDPATTPSSTKEGASGSSRESDISENDNLNINLDVDVNMMMADANDLFGQDLGGTLQKLEGLDMSIPGLDNGMYMMNGNDFEMDMGLGMGTGTGMIDMSADWDAHFGANAGLDDGSIPGWS